MLKFYRRGNCRTEGDIGAWKNMIKITSFYGTITNVGLLIFTMNTFKDINPFQNTIYEDALANSTDYNPKGMLLYSK